MFNIKILTIIKIVLTAQLFFFGGMCTADQQTLKEELLLTQARTFGVKAEYQSLGVLDIYQGKTRIDIPNEYMDWNFQVGYNYLNASDSELSLPKVDEVDLLLQGSFTFLNDLIELSIGGNIRESKYDSLVIGGLKWTHSFNQNSEGYLRIGVNEISYETSALRALGAKDTILLGIFTRPLPQMYINFEADGHRYITRGGSSLGEGYKVNFNIGGEVLKVSPIWQVRIQGSWEQNYLREVLPPELIPSLPSTSGLDTIVAPEYGTLGVGTSVHLGSSPQGFVRHPFLLVDLWAGWAWPANQLAYNGRLGVGISLFGPDVLSLDASYGNVQGGVSGQDFITLGLQYILRF